MDVNSNSKSKAVLSILGDIRGESLS